MKQRPYQSTDLPSVIEIYIASIRSLAASYYSPEQIAGWLKNRTPQGYLPGIERGEMFVVVDGERIVGFGHAVPGEVVAVYVAPEWARHGVGRSILAEGIMRARSGHQGAVRLNATLNAQGFYEKAGFVEVERKTVRRNDVLLPVIVMELKDEI